MIRTGFFEQLFNQFVALISALCVTAAPAPAPAAVLDKGPPGVVERFDPTPLPRGDSLLIAVIDTQFNAFVGIGRATAASADRFSISVLRVPSDFADALNRGGITNLPAGAATSARRFVLAFRDSATGLVEAISDAALGELALVPGPRFDQKAAAYVADALAPKGDPAYVAALQRQPLIARVIQTQVDGVVNVGTAVAGAATDLGVTLLATPATIAAAVAKGGPMAIPAGLATAARQIVMVVRDGVTRVIGAVSDLALAELDLIPGSSGKDTRAFALVGPGSDLPTTGIIPRLIMTAVRLPLAVGVAAADLVVAGMQATVVATGAVATAATDVVRAAVNPRGEDTLGAAIARVPATLVAGGQDAAATLQRGVQRARTDFRTTLNPRTAEVSASGGLNTMVNGVNAGTLASVNPTDTTPSNGKSGSSNNTGDPDPLGTTTTAGATGLGTTVAGNTGDDSNADADAAGK